MRNSTPQPNAWRVALAFPARTGHVSSILRGVTDYARAHGRWFFTTGGEWFDLPVATLKKWRGDGVIAVLRNAADAVAARRLTVPVVTFVGMARNPGVPRVMMDQAAIGTTAAEHLITRGFRHFAFYGLRGLAYSADRERSFAQYLSKRGFRVDRYHTPGPSASRRPWDEMAAIGRWINGLPSPVGLFAANDERARMIADACGQAGRRVPQDVGIIGVDNDEIACEFGDPTLTSIACDWTVVGFETAKLLDRLMRGEPAPAGDQLIPPTGVVSRESTDVMITDDPSVALAVAFARDRLGKSFGVEALVQAAGVSRRHLELLFARSLGCTPALFLARLRSEKAKELLGIKGKPLTAIAKECGFSDLRHFGRAFERVVKLTPRQYRKEAGAAAQTRRP